MVGPIQVDAERARQEVRRAEQPCVLAVVPDTPWLDPHDYVGSSRRSKVVFPADGCAPGLSKCMCLILHFSPTRCQEVRGWNLCRRRKQSEVLFGWQAVHDPEPRPTLHPGDLVRARRCTFRSQPITPLHLVLASDGRLVTRFSSLRMLATRALSWGTGRVTPTAGTRAR